MVAIFISCFLLTTLIVVGVTSPKDENPKHLVLTRYFWLVDFLRPLLIIITLLLFISLTSLTIQLYRQQRVYNVSSRCGLFKKEILTLLVILTFFLLSYALRISWYDLYFTKLEKNIWGQAWISFALSIPFDFLPLLLMLILHYRNFRFKTAKNNDEIANEADKILHLNLIVVSELSSSDLDSRRSSIVAQITNHDLFSSKLNESQKRSILSHNDATNSFIA